MSKTIQEDQWVWVVVQDPEGNEQFLGQRDETEDISFIPTFLKKDAKPAFLIDTLDKAQMGAHLLKEWNLPNTGWQSVEFQRYPEFSPLSKIPLEIRENVTILYMVHLCCRLFQGYTEQELSTTFLDEYKRLMKWERFSLVYIAQKGYPAKSDQ